MTISATTQGLRPGVCTSTSRPSTPFDGQVIYETDTNTLAVYDGSGWVSLNPVDRDRNVVINGAMQIAQRGTSTTGITAGGYYTADRWGGVVVSLGTWTQSIENDAPTGSGFRRSVKMLCTTADASPAAADLLTFRQLLEGQNLQKFNKGTTSAKPFTMSFWVKSNVTGTYIVELRDHNNTRAVSASYTIGASATWEKKTITFPADASGEFTNDNNRSLDVNWVLATGSDYSSGTLQTTWSSITNANRYVGQTNLASATNNYWQITGVQLEAGAVATPFEFEDYSTTLAKCQRYYQRMTAATAYGIFGYGSAATTTAINLVIDFFKEMRVAPTAFEISNVGAGDGANAVIAPSATSMPHTSTRSALLLLTVTGAVQFRFYFAISNNNASAYIGFSAEL